VHIYHPGHLNSSAKRFRINPQWSKRRLDLDEFDARRPERLSVRPVRLLFLRAPASRAFINRWRYSSLCSLSAAISRYYQTFLPPSY
jgi:hypothetical protein